MLLRVVGSVVVGAEGLRIVFRLLSALALSADLIFSSERNAEAAPGRDNFARPFAALTDLYTIHKGVLRHIRHLALRPS